MDCPADAGLLAQGVANDEVFDVVPVNLIITEVAHRKLQEILNFEPGDVVLTVAQVICTTCKLSTAPKVRDINSTISTASLSP